MRIRLVVAVCMVAVALSTVAPLTAPAANYKVHAGWDLFDTNPNGTSFHPVPVAAVPLVANCKGVPVNSYDFPGVGVRATGTTDTIVRRLADATPSSPTVPIELVMLQLQCDMDLAGHGVPTPVYVTLQSNRGLLDPPGGSPSGGQLQIQFYTDGTGGMASSNLTVHYDVRLGSLTGPIINLGGALIPDTVSLGTTAPWVHQLPSNMVACLKELGILASHGVIDQGFYITAVNYLLNGTDPGEDFNYGQLERYCLE